MRYPHLLDRVLAAGVGTAKPAGTRDLDEHLARLRPRLDLLPKPDRMLIELALPGHMTLRELARLLGQDPGTLSRRQRSLWRRLHNPILDILFSKKLSENIPPEYRQIGVEHFLIGITICDLADKHRMTKIQIQQALSYIHGAAASLSSTR